MYGQLVGTLQLVAKISLAIAYEEGITGVVNTLVLSQVATATVLDVLVG